MLLVTIPGYRPYQAPESAEMNIRNYLISKLPPHEQLKCKIEILPNEITNNVPVEKPKPEPPKSKERLEMEAQAKELGIRGAHLYSDEKLIERITLKAAKADNQNGKLS